MSKFVTLVGVLVLLISGARCALGSEPDVASRSLGRPNIILINIDDADFEMFSPSMIDLYPNIKRIASEGISFTNVHVTTPFCGPSRAALFRGQYAHHTGIRINIPDSPLSIGFKGGYGEFLRQHWDQDELGVWMKNQGYRTMMIGKYHHNGFDFRKPPGWDDFYMSNGGRYDQTYRFTTQTNVLGSHSRNPPGVYRTDQEAEDAVQLIRQHQNRRQASADKSDQPFFLYVAPFAPHRAIGRDVTKMVDKKKYGEWQADLQVPRTPDFDEPQMSDKPIHRQSPPYSEQEMDALDREYVSRARAVKSVDDLVGRLFQVLKDGELLEETYLIFTSDNGYQLGQHRLHNKLDPYQMSTHVPLYIRGPGITPHQAANHLLAHIDICPTILGLAGAEIPDFVDGKSFETLLVHSKTINERNWRDPVVIENWQAKRCRGKVLPGAYSGLRFYDQVYVEWATGDKEFYDLAKDPFQLENQYLQLSTEKKKGLKQALQSSRKNSMTPLVTVLSAPVESNDQDAQIIRGYAEDDRIISHVMLTVKDTATQRFWNGKLWEEEPFDLTATLSANDQQIVAWRYPIHSAIRALDVVSTPSDEGAQATSQPLRKIRFEVTATALDGDAIKSDRFLQTIEIPD